jgi:hypothetical protein
MVVLLLGFPGLQVAQVHVGQHVGILANAGDQKPKHKE